MTVKKRSCHGRNLRKSNMTSKMICRLFGDIVCKINQLKTESLSEILGREIYNDTSLSFTYRGRVSPPYVWKPPMNPPYLGTVLTVLSTFVNVGVSLWPLIPPCLFTFWHFYLGIVQYNQRKTSSAFFHTVHKP